MGVLIAVSIVCFTLILLGVLFLRYSGRDSGLWMKQEIEALRSDFKESLDRMIGQVNDRLRDNMNVMQDTNKTLGDRLDNAARVVGTVREQLGQLHESSKKIFEVGKDISSLQDLLRAPKLRGGIGEFFLEDILGQILPREFFERPYTFKNGQQVDAAIKFGKGIVPIDSKFPLENFKRLIEASSEQEKKQAKKQFVSDVKKHISDIADKYILPDEGTFDFALMYIPAENIYYETIIKDERFSEDSGLFQYSLDKKVIPVSPNSFYAYLQVILLGLKGMVVEKSAKEFLNSLDRLQGDLNRFQEEFLRLGKHINNTTGSFDDAQKRLEKIQAKVAQISGLKDGSALIGKE
ncbi:MAG: DNA recombination protein RmuC [Candidatus Omnitrophota bacterium]